MTQPQISPPALAGHVARSVLYAFLTISAVFFLLPMALVLMNSLKSVDELRLGNLLQLPTSPSLDAWFRAWSSACTGLDCGGIEPGLWNSVRITVPATIISTIAGALNGYALSQWRSRYVDLVLMLTTIGLFVPLQAMLYPVVKIFSTIGIFRTYPSLVLAHVVFGMPYVTLLLRNFYIAIPEEISRAARMEGSKFLRTFWSIILPMSRNILIVVAILQFTAIWNDYLVSLIFAGADDVPMTVLLTNIVGGMRAAAEPNVNMAAAVIAAVPTLVIYFVSGRYFIRGIAAGAVKG